MKTNMTQEDMIRLAKEAGFNFVNSDDQYATFWRFATLVAAHEGEAIAKLFDGPVWAYDYREIAQVIRARGQK